MSLVTNEFGEASSADGVISDAIKATERFLLQDALSNPRSFAGATGDAKASRYDTLLSLHSRDHCITASAFAIDQLQRNSNSFPILMLINGSSQETNVPFTFNPQLLNHTYALTQDSKDVWRAFSPANHKRGQTLSPMHRIFEGDTASEVLGKIQEADGGSWPSGKVIDQSIIDGYFTPQNRVTDSRGETKLDIFTVDEALPIKHPGYNQPFGSFTYTLAKK